MPVRVNKKALVIVLVALVAVAIGIAAVAKWALNSKARAAASLKEARALVAQGQYDAAVIHYKSAIKNDSANSGAEIELAEIYFKQGDMAQSYTFYKDALKNDPANVGILSKIAGFYYLGGQWEDLKKTSAMIVSLAPGGAIEAQAHHNLAQAYYRDGDYRQAAAEFARAAEMNAADVEAVLSNALINLQRLNAPKDAETALKRLAGRAQDESLDKPARADAALCAAKYYWAAEQSKNAEAMLQSAIALAPAEARYRTELGDFYKQRGRDAESMALAEKAYTDAVGADPKSATALLALGVFYRDTGRDDKAIEIFRSAVAMAPAPVTYEYLIEGLIDKGDIKDAAAQIAEMRKIKNSDISADFLEGRVNVVESKGSGEKLRKAEELFRKVTRLRSDYAPAHYQLGLVLAARGMYEDAAVEFQKASVAGSEVPGAAVALAETYMRSFQYDRAVAQAQSILERNGRDFYANLTMGRALAAQGKLTEARGFLEQARQARPSAVEPYIALAQVLARSDKFDEALRTLDKAAKESDDPTRAQITIAELYRQNGQQDKALETASAVTSAKPEDAEAAASYASLLWQMGRAEDALDFLTLRSDTYAADTRYQVLVGDFRRSMGKLDDALTAYKRALQTAADDKGALVGAASTLVSLGKYSQARADLELLRKADPGATEADMVEARILQAEGKVDAAVTLLENSLRQSPANPEGYYRLALIQQERGDNDRAIENLKTALKYNPGLVAARLALAQVYFQTKFYEDALREAQRVTRASEAGSGVMGQAASIAVGSLVQTKRVDEAIVQWSQAPPEMKNSGDYFVRLGYLYLMSSDYPRSEDAFKKAQQLMPGGSGALEGLARLYLASGHPDEAAGSASAALAAETESAARVRLLQLAANIALVRGDRDGAVAVMSKMVEAAGKDAALIWQAGDAFQAMGQTDKALEAYRQAAAADANNALATRRLVATLVDQGKTDEAGKIVDKLLAANPADFDSVVLKAHVLLAENTQAKISEAAKILSQAVESPAAQGKPSAAARYLLGGIYFRLGQMATAETQVRRALSEDPTLAAAKILLAKILIVNRSYEDATVLAREVLKDYPGNAEVYAILGDVAVISGKMPEAAESYRKSLSLQQNPAVLMALATTLTRLGKDAEALAAVEDYVKAVPGDIEMTRGLATMYESRKDYAKAEETLRRLVNANNDDAESVYALSRVLKDEGRLKDADELLRWSLGRKPAPLAYRYLAGIQSLAGDAAGAEATLRTGIKGFGNNEYLYADLAALVAAGGRVAEAAGILKEGIAANDQVEQFYVALAVFYMSHNMAGDAEKFLKDTSDRSPKLTGILCMLGNTYLAKGDTSGARAVYERAVKYAPEDARAANALAYVLADTGTDLDRAVTLASYAAGKLPTSPDVSDTLGWAYYKSGKFANAVASLSTAAGMSSPPSPTILYHLALAYSKVDAAARARETAQELVAADPAYADKPEIKEILARQ
jgi:tetratricopeptide (TPR) repeat protein